jgi:hypothetical protein
MTRRSSANGPIGNYHVHGLAMGLTLLASSGLAVAQCGQPSWHATAGVSGPTAPNVGAVASWDPDGAGPLPAVLAIGGVFTAAGGVAANNIAVWNGSTYAPLGSGIAGEVDALAVLPDGRLVAAGGFTSAGGTPVANIAVWDGTTWSAMGSGLNNQVWALAVNPVTGDLVAGGMFTTAGGVAANRVAKWNGSAWSSLGSGTANGVNNIVYALSATPTGDIIVGGNFLTAGGVFNRRSVARYGADGLWYSLGAGMNAAVLSVATLSDGSIVASGIFTFAGAGNASRIARWDGANWIPMGLGLNTQALALLPLTHGQVIAGGHFFFAGSVAANKIALWNGTDWEAMGTGMDQYIIGLAQMPNGDVFAGGGFSTADGLPSPYLARWASDPCCPADLDDGSGSGTKDGGVDVNDLLFFLAQFESGAAPADLDNGTGTGTPDGGVDINDLLFFLVHFEAGC